MPYRIEILVEEKLVQVVFEGMLDDEVSQKSADELRARLGSRRDFDLIVDFTRADFAPLRSRTVLKRTGEQPIFENTSRHAFVAPGDLSFGFANMYKAMRDDAAGEIRVFRNLHEAYEWLGREAPVSRDI